MSHRNSILAFASISLTAVAVVIIALLMGSHMPFRSEPAAKGQFERRTGHWQAVYVLGADCPCSGRVAKHLAHPARLPGIDEQVAFVGAEPATESLLQLAGVRLVRRTAKEAYELYGARSAPLLLFIDPSGVIRYSGGFARRSDFRDGFQEARLWAELRQNHQVATMPAFGCALQLGCESGGVSAALGF